MTPAMWVFAFVGILLGTATGTAIAVVFFSWAISRTPKCRLCGSNAHRKADFCFGCNRHVCSKCAIPCAKFRTRMAMRGRGAFVAAKIPCIHHDHLQLTEQPK